MDNYSFEKREKNQHLIYAINQTNDIFQSLIEKRATCYPCVNNEDGFKQGNVNTDNTWVLPFSSKCGFRQSCGPTAKHMPNQHCLSSQATSVHDYGSNMLANESEPPSRYQIDQLLGRWKGKKRHLNQLSYLILASGQSGTRLFHPVHYIII